MPTSHLPLGALLAAARQPATLAPWAEGSLAVVVVDLDAGVAEPVAAPAAVRAVVVGTTMAASPTTHAAAPLCDVVVAPGDPVIDRLVAGVERNPLAAEALTLLLRGSARRSLEDGLVAESAVYSTLQAGPEFAAWRRTRPVVAREPEGDAVRLARAGGALEVCLTRPHVRNALNTTMRDQLVDAFELPALDPSITEVHLRGEGPDFCAGGDLDEFGSFPDPATAHVVRLQRSAGRAIAAVRERVVAHVHGACLGSGIELPAFAARVEAAADTTIGLPELSLGLIPGAGGTVSLPARIGRHRTALLALAGMRIDAPTALEWGLVDALVER